MKKIIGASLKQATQSQVASKPARRHQASLFQNYSLAATVAFAVLLFFARQHPYFGWDLKITRALQKFSPPWFDRLMRAISWPGFPPQVYVVLGAVELLLYRAGLKWEAVATFFAMLGPGALGTLVKRAIDRPRPTPDLVKCVNPDLDGGHWSFAAGHVQAYTAIVGFLGFLSFSLYRRSPLRALERLLYAVMIALIGPARIQAGEHWTSDVVGGYLLGFIWLDLTIKFYRWGKPRFFVNQPTAPANTPE